VFTSLFKKRYFGTRTFTYYIPAPPMRKTGYQEREFDSLTGHITSLGFDLIDFKLEAHASEAQAGLWVLCTLGAPSKEIYNKKIDPMDSSVFHNNPNADLDIPLDESITHEI
jgi:hypothetical protein